MRNYAHTAIGHRPIGYIRRSLCGEILAAPCCGQVWKNESPARLTKAALTPPGWNTHKVSTPHCSLGFRGSQGKAEATNEVPPNPVTHF